MFIGAKLLKNCDAKPKGLRQYAMSAGCNKKMRFIGNYIFYVEKLLEECIGDEGNEKRKEMEKN